MARPEAEVTGDRISVTKFNELFAEQRDLFAELRDLFRVVKRDKRDALSIQEFCESHGLSVPMFYKLRKLGQTPVEMHVGTRVLISKESAAAWRKAREREHA